MGKFSAEQRAILRATVLNYQSDYMILHPANPLPIAY